MSILGRGEQRQKQANREKTNIVRSDGSDEVATIPSTMNTENGCEGGPGKEVVMDDIGDGDSNSEKRGAGDEEERSLFSTDEADAFTTYLVESQQAFSFLNVTGIQHGKLSRFQSCK